MAGNRSDETHLRCFLDIISEPDAGARARRATEEIQRLDTERADFTALRDVAVHRLAAVEGKSYTQVGEALGLGKDRAAQLVRRAHETQPTAVQAVARVRRLARRVVGDGNDGAEVDGVGP